MAARGDVRSRMVAGATTLMRTHGFSATSFRDVWELTGTPRGSVYFHFPRGKEELGRAVIDDALDTLVGWTSSARAEAHSLDAFVAGLASRLADFLQRSEFQQGCPIAAIAVEGPRSFPELRPAAAVALDTWRNLVADAFVDNGVPAGRAGDLAGATVAALEGAIMLGKAERSTAPLFLAARLVSLAADGLVDR